MEFESDVKTKRSCLFYYSLGKSLRTSAKLLSRNLFCILNRACDIYISANHWIKKSRTIVNENIYCPPDKFWLAINSFSTNVTEIIPLDFTIFSFTFKI